MIITRTSPEDAQIILNVEEVPTARRMYIADKSPAPGVRPTTIRHA